MKHIVKAAALTLLLIGCKKSNDLQDTNSVKVSATTQPVFIRVQAVDHDGAVTNSSISFIKLK